MTRATIITDLMACLRGMGPAQGQALAAAKVLRGIHLVHEVNQTPALCLFNERVESVDQTSGSAERSLVLHVWGAVHAAHGDYDDLDRLAASVVGALALPALNPHWQRTSCGNLEVYEGGAGDPLGLFDLEVTVTYEAGLGEL